MLRERMDAHPELDRRQSAEEAVRETMAVAVAGVESLTTRETALMNLLASFSLTFAAARVSTYLIRSRGPSGPFRDLVVGDRHIHHFVPGAVIAFLAGGASIAARDEELDKWLAFPFGAGAALVFDEAALLLELEDVYWSEEGVVSVQIAFAAITLLASIAYGLQRIRLGGGERTTEQEWRTAASAWQDLQALEDDPPAA